MRKHGEQAMPRPCKGGVTARHWKSKGRPKIRATVALDPFQRTHTAVFASGFLPCGNGYRRGGGA
jgi:hypothetical protein